MDLVTSSKGGCCGLVSPKMMIGMGIALKVAYMYGGYQLLKLPEYRPPENQQNQQKKNNASGTIVKIIMAVKPVLEIIFLFILYDIQTYLIVDIGERLFSRVSVLEFAVFVSSALFIVGVAAKAVKDAGVFLSSKFLNSDQTDQN
ncbi:hypothetical protein K0U07_02420 [bacterium]|nr:hypothetical protein [bacterium]